VSATISQNLRALRKSRNREFNRRGAITAEKGTSAGSLHCVLCVFALNPLSLNTLSRLATPLSRLKNAKTLGKYVLVTCHASANPLAARKISALTQTGSTARIAGFTEAAYNPASDTLYYMNSALGSLYEMNMTTGAGGLVGNTGVTELRGLAFVPEPASFSVFVLGLAILAANRTMAEPKNLKRVGNPALC